MRVRITIGWSMAMAALLSACASDTVVLEDRYSPGALEDEQAEAQEQADREALLRVINAPEADVFIPMDVSSGDVVERREGMVVAQGDGRRYRVFFGESEAGIPGRVEYRNASPEVVVHQGYGYAWGWRPFITTDRVTTATDGTKVMVVIDRGDDPSDPMDDAHQIILLGGGGVDVTVRSELAVCGPRERSLSRPWTYVECTLTTNANGDPCVLLSRRMRLADADASLQDLVEEVMLSRRIRRVAD